MGFEELLAAVALFVGMPWAVFSGIAKVKAASRGEGDSLRKSELEAMIQDAVAQAVEPFQRRIETLEAIATDEDAGQRRLDAAVLAGAFPGGVADALEPDVEPADSAAVPRRVRS